MSATERLRTPMHFPCAARVKMPQLGSEDSDMKDGLKSNRYAPDSIVFKVTGQPNEPISKDYLKKVSTGLSFEEEVVKERCYHALPYDEKYMFEAFDIGDLVPLPRRTRIPVGRHNARGVDMRHMPCNLTKSTKSHLKPLTRRITQRAREMHLEALKREELREINRNAAKEDTLDQLDEEENENEEPKEGVFLTETKVQLETGKSVISKPPSDILSTGDTVEEKRGNDWDAYLMSMLSTNTANWIVYERTPVGSQDRNKLTALLKKWHGEPDHTDLIRDDMSDTEMEPGEEEENKKPQKKWKKKEATLLERVYDIEDVEPEAHDPYSDDNKAPFYRQPAGLRRARKHEEKEELGAINTTAANIAVQTFKPSPPPTLRDFINPEVGNHVIETDNMFQQEQLTGTEQVYEAFGDKTKIVMENNNKYKKELQPAFPQPPEQWFPETDVEKQLQLKNKKKQKKFERGHRRWKNLPEPIDVDSDTVPYGYDAEFHREADPTTMKMFKRNMALMRATDAAKSLNYSDRGSAVKKYNPEELLRKLQEKKRGESIHDPKFIIDEWRTKWHLSGQYVDSTPEDLIKDMADIQAHVRLKAIATCAKASDYRPPTDHGIQLEYMNRDETATSMPEKLFVALECLLDDPVDKVKKASAITLYSLNRPSEKAEEILYNALQNENPVDRWAAAQCLAHFGVCDSDVVGEILKQVMTTEDTIKHERGISMLGILSITSNLVHSMVAEQLNSSSWRHKVIACKILPTLRGDINKDITNKLSDLMWNDWHSEVRRAAAQCLGKTGHGRDVHDDLRERIMNGDERLKLEALNKVGQLGIMTAKLLPAFLKCFEDEYVAVRSEVCISCGNLAIKDEEVIAKLIHLATFDTIWKVKALAFQAIGKIGVITEQITDSLLWAVRYEENPGVRAEACHTLKVLKAKTEEVADVLQDRFLVESNPLVRDELASTLKMFDISATEDMDMVAQIKKEVKKLCTRNIIASQITLNEHDDDRRENMARMIYESEKEMKEQERQPEPMMERLRSLSRSSSHVKLEESGRSTPEQGRDTVFTPTADQELEAILGKEELMSGKTSPTDQGTTPGDKSGTTSVGSQGDGEDSNDEGDEDNERDEREDQTGDEDEGTERSSRGSQTPGKTSTETAEPSSRGSQTPGKISEEEVDGEIAIVIERPTSTVKFASHLEVADIPSRSRSSLGPSRLSLMDDQGKPSRLSNATGTTGTEGMVFGRDAVVEREKINEEARNTFAVMDLRYRDMVQDLIDLDNTFELGLTSGSRQDFEDKINSMKIVQTPPSSAKHAVEVSVAKVESSADGVIDVDNEKEIGEPVEDKNGGKNVLDEKQLSQSELEIKDKDTNELKQSDVEIIETESQDKI